ncbi:endospore germination permease [Bacillus timonensis]|nr:endospore germination permease [Bacillus timonensis]
MKQHEEKISGLQYFAIVLCFTIGSSIILTPPFVTSHARQDAWVSAIISSFIGIGIVFIYVAINRLFPKKTSLEMVEFVLGKWGGKLFFLFLFGYSFLLSAMVLRNIGDFMATQVMPETPIQAIHIAFLAVVIFAVKQGIETISRTAEIFTPWIIGLLLILISFTLPELERENMLPVLENGWKPIAKGSLIVLSSPILETWILLFLMTNVNKQKSAINGYLAGVFFGGLVIFVITFLSILVIGPDFTARNTYPAYILGKKISIGEFLERIEVIVAIIWMLTIFFKVTLCFYVSVIAFARIFEFKDYRPYTLPLGMIMIVLSIIVFPHLSYFIELGSVTWVPFSITSGLVIPLFLLAFGLIKKKMMRSKQPSSNSQDSQQQNGT